MKQKWRLRLTSTAIIAALGLFAAACSSPAASGDQQQEETVTPVKVSTIAKGALTVRNEIIGVTMPSKNYEVLPKMNGELAEVRVKKGDYVEAGTVIGVVDTEDLRTQIRINETTLAQAQAQLRNAELTLEQAQSSVEKRVLPVDDQLGAGAANGGSENGAADNGAADGEVNASSADASVDGEGAADAAEGGDSTEGTANGASEGVDRTDLELQNARLQLEQAQKNLERMTALHAEGLISDQQYEQAVAGEQQARIAYQQVLLAADHPDFSVDQARIGVETAQISVDQATINLNQARNQLADATIVAPISGQVVSVGADPGEMVSMQAPFVVIIATNPITVTADISVNQLLMLQGQEEIQVELPDLGQTYTAKVTYISPTTNASGFYSIEAELDNADNSIKAGMVSKILIDQDLVQEAILVPTSSIIEQGGSSYVFIVKNDRAVRVDVDILEQQTDITAVAGDLAEGDQIVVTGQMTLSPDSKVRIIDGEGQH